MATQITFKVVFHIEFINNTLSSPVQTALAQLSRLNLKESLKKKNVLENNVCSI